MSKQPRMPRGSAAAARKRIAARAIALGRLERAVIDTAIMFYRLTNGHVDWTPMQSQIDTAELAHSEAVEALMQYRAEAGLE